MGKIPQKMARPAAKARSAGRSTARRVGGVVAPLGIAAAGLAAANEARKEGSSIGDAVLVDGIDTAKSFAAFGAATAATTYALMKGSKVAHAAGLTAKAGMTLAKASGIASIAVAGYGAVQGAREAKAGGTSVLAGAAQGAWDYSLPGMLWSGAKDAYQGVKDYRQIQKDEAARFAKANQVWQSGKRDLSVTGDTYKRTRRDPRSGKIINETVRKRMRANPDWDIGIDPKKKDDDE